jgi:transposase
LEGRQVKKAQVRNEEEALRLFFHDLVGKEVVVALEATCNYYWMYQFLAKLGFAVKLAHPYKTRIIGEAKIKTDKIDATILADLLRADMLPESFIPSEEIRDLRELVRHRMRLVRNRTLLKNQVHAILIKNNLQHSFTDLFGKAGMQWLLTLNLPQEYRYQVNQLLSLIGTVNDHINHIEKKIRKRATRDPLAQRLMQIDGISYFTSLLLIAEIGSIERFPTYKHLTSFVGIAPSVHSSGQTRYTAHITRQGNKYIRWVLCEAVTKAIKKNKQLRLFFEDIRNAKGYAKAVVATARKMLIGIYYVWRFNAEFKPVRNYRLKQAPI